MGYELIATMTKGADTQEFTVAPGRSSLVRVMDAIAKVHPEACAGHSSGYTTATLTPEQGTALFTTWHADLETLTDEDGCAVPGNGFGADMEDDLVDVLVFHVADMLALAKEGYTATFVPE